MTRLPSEEQLRKEIRETIKQNPKFMMCINCAHYCKLTRQCHIYKRMMLPYVPASSCAGYEANYEMLLREATKELHTQASECEKIEFLLAMALTSANTTTLFVEDMDRRVKAAYRREKAKKEHRREASMLKKDCDLAEQMDGAFDKITQFIEDMKDGYHECIEAYVAKLEKSLEGIDTQYRHYIQSHIDRIFKKGGEYNDEANSNFNSDAGQFALVQAEFARVAHHNLQNAEDVFAFMENMENVDSEGLPNRFCLDKDDKKFYLKQGR